MGDLITAGGQPLSEAEIIRYLDTFCFSQDLQAHEKKQFVQMCQAFALNPLKREIYIVAYGKGEWRKCSIIVGYEVYIKRAERTGKLDGWKAEISGSGQDMKAVVTIYRKDWSRPFAHEAYFDEAVKKTRNKEGSEEPTKTWKEMPRFMLKKTAIAQAFRLCFSDELGGMPYEEAEIVNDDKPETASSIPVQAELSWREKLLDLHAQLKAGGCAPEKLKTMQEDVKTAMLITDEQQRDADLKAIYQNYAEDMPFKDDLPFDTEGSHATA